MRSIDKRVVFAAVLCLAFSAVAKAQLISTYSYTGTSAGALWGESVNGAGDVDGDGYDDFIVGGSEDDTSAADAGRATVYSGFDGSVIHTFHGAVAASFMGFSVDGVGDIDGDGFDDVIVSDLPPVGTNFGPGRALVYSGQTGILLATLVGDSNNDVFGFCVSGAGDVDADGTPDIIVGAPFDDNNGADSGNVRVISGATFLTLYSIDGNSGGANLGVTVSGAGDVNADGFDDFIAGAPRDSSTGTSLGGSVHVYSGFDGSVLYSYFGPQGHSRFGHAVSGAGDVDADGFDDFMFSRPGERNGAFIIGRVNIYSGQTGAVITMFQSAVTGSLYGQDVGDCGDVNGDGIPDVIIAEPGNSFGGTPHVYVHSGLGGPPIETITLPAGSGNELRASGAGDLNDDGFADIVFGRRMAGGNGTVDVMLATTLPVLNYRSKQGFSSLQLEWLPANGNISDLNGILFGSGASSNAMGLYGVSLAPAELSVMGLPLLIAVDVAVNLIQSGMFAFGGFGGHTTTNISRQHPAIAGSLVHIQWFEISPSIASSNGIRLKMEP
ncbi:MAG: hypothetical protein ACI97A_004168 [Planctomycetota bacterium]|jgi:hypothetical protein